MYLRPSQVIILIAAVACNLAFVPVFQKWVRFHEWGAYAFTIPNEPISLFHLKFMATDVVSAHVMLSFLLLALLIFQMAWMSFRGNRKIHKIVGTFSIFGVGLSFFVVSVFATIFVLKTPFNQVMYFVLPFVIQYELLRAYACARRRDFRQHIDAVFVATVILNSAPIYRMVLVAIYHVSGGHPIWTADQHPVDGAALVTFALLIALVVAPRLVGGEKYRLSLTPFALFLVLIVALATLPFEFFGAPERSRLFDLVF